MEFKLDPSISLSTCLLQSSFKVVSWEQANNSSVGNDFRAHLREKKSHVHME